LRCLTLDVAQLPQRVRADELADAPPVRLKAQFVVEPRDTAGMLSGCCHHLSGFERVDRHRFFAQDMLAGVERGDRVARV
jgi:hypothetical protein